MRFKTFFFLNVKKTNKQSYKENFSIFWFSSKKAKYIKKYKNLRLVLKNCHFIFKIVNNPNSHTNKHATKIPPFQQQQIYSKAKNKNFYCFFEKLFY